MRRFILLLIVGSLIGACTSGDSRDVTTSSSETTSSGEGQPVAWAIQVFRGGRATIATVDAGGGSASSPGASIPGGDQTNPDWSADGSQIAFAVSDGARDDLWVTNVDGTDPRLVYDCEGPCDYIDDPAWSPDGESIAVCMMSADGNDHIGTLASIDVTTGAATVLYRPDRKETFCAGPRWSPNGRFIVLEFVERVDTAVNGSVTGVTLSIVDLSVDPATTVTLTAPSVFAVTPDWSRDGELLVYSALPEAGARAPDLFTVRTDGSGMQRRTFLADNGGSATEPTFERDGTTVVFVSSGVLARLDLTTNEVSPAFTKATPGNHPRPRPTGS